ncbi:unnamed protein product [Allacma fusca]|uniref:Uncharacterized protein n=1 Tax=Allacma fusca TaxID=39272 RepID=A0A8J2PAH5_9HEXA|nr:unnamed protein product [Allacma fusca]
MGNICTKFVGENNQNSPLNKTQTENDISVTRRQNAEAPVAYVPDASSSKGIGLINFFYPPSSKTLLITLKKHEQSEGFWNN